MEKKQSGISRRAFMRTAAAGVAAAGVMGRAAAEDHVKTQAKEDQTEKTAEGTRVVAVKSAGAFSGSEPDSGAVAKMLDAGAGALAGGAGEELWKSLFGADDVVGIKLNCISRTAKPNKALIDAVTASLMAAGVKENNIIVWDRFEDQLARRARLKLNTASAGVRVYGTERSGDDLSGYDEKVFYESDQDTAEYRAGTGTKSLVTKIITTDCTKIINMPVLKDHNQAGVTGCLKNLAFGAVNNTARFHRAPMYCSPAIADIYSIPAVRQKTVLHVLDALRVCYNGGPDAINPAYITRFGAIYLATDPVACDTIALEVVDKLRADAGLPNLYETSGHPVHIAEAAKRGLGEGERNKVEVVSAEV